jgi:AcrR family transcriptional regulator
MLGRMSQAAALRGQAASDGTATPGRRERKKAATRAALTDAARRLFLERGYDQVTVADIAAEADTAVTTLFKHFPDGKDALVFGDAAGDTERADSLVAAVRDRAPGTGPVPALREFFRGRGVFDPASTPAQREIVDLVVRTPTLRAYARRQWEVCEGPLTAALAEAAGLAPDDAATRALARFVLQVPDLAGTGGDALVAFDAVFDHLEQGWPAPAGH